MAANGYAFLSSPLAICKEKVNRDQPVVCFLEMSAATGFSVGIGGATTIGIFWYLKRSRVCQPSKKRNE